MPRGVAATLASISTIKLEDRHFEYIEELNEQGGLSKAQRARLWTIERELNRRATTRKHDAKR